MIFGMAPMRAAAFSSPVAFVFMMKKAAMPCEIKACRSSGFFLMALSLASTTQPSSPHLRSHSVSGASWAKWSACASTLRPILRRASGTVPLPRDLSTKNVKGSSRSADISFVLDGFFDLLRRDVIVFSQVVEAIPREEPFRNNVGGDSGANEDWPAERN